MKEFAGRYALVTGASSGIGFWYAHYLAQRGYNIVAVSNQKEQLYSVADLLTENFGVATYPIYMDLASEKAALELYNKVKAFDINIEMLVNNAGIFELNTLSAISSDKIDLFINLHVRTLTHICKLFGEDMKARKKGYIINMSSLSAFTPLPCIAMYVATKSFINSFSQSLRYELKPFGVHVTSVCPGGIATGLYNLPASYQKLGLRLGVLMTCEKLVRKAVKAVFKNKRKITPGFFNRLFMVFVPIVPDSLYLFMQSKLRKWTGKEL